MSEQKQDQDQGRNQDAAAPLPALARYALLALGGAATGLAALGVFLPVLPTTPFLLLAVWAFARASPRLHAWLYEHPRFGPFLRDWRDEGAIPRRAKVAAVLGMLLAWHIVFFSVANPWVPAAVGLCLGLVAAYVVSRPVPRRAAGAAAAQRRD